LLALALGLVTPGLVRAAAAGPAAPVVFTSGEAHTRLIELFTSEGCSSCPPAEDWLAGLRNEPRQWRDFVPVSFHVVYWDNLGWPDRFATKAFTARQYALAASWSGKQVYTPCFTLDGSEWKTLGNRAAPPAIGKAGVLRVEYAADGATRVTFAPAGANTAAAYDVQLAFLGGGISSEVRAGENAGHTLRHEFVALSLTTCPMKPDGGGWQATTIVPKPVVAGVKDLALAAWVTPHGQLAPVQATGGWLP
jgi:hypothetical protein